MAYAPCDVISDKFISTLCASMLWTFNLVFTWWTEAQGYANDHQFHLSFRPIPSTNQTASVTAIENCVAEVRSWMISNMLMVNDSKTEFLL